VELGALQQRLGKASEELTGVVYPVGRRPHFSIDLFGGDAAAEAISTSDSSLHAPKKNDMSLRLKPDHLTRDDLNRCRSEDRARHGFETRDPPKDFLGARVTADS
jgi:hypothetical protein